MYPQNGLPLPYLIALSEREAMPDNSTSPILRVANCSGFYGDRLSAARDMVEGGPIDVLTGDYLAELMLSFVQESPMQR